MTALTLADARKIIKGALAKARKAKMKPLTVAVLDAGGNLKALEREDGASNMRPDIATAKANGALAMGLGSRALYERAKVDPGFIQAMNALAGGYLVPIAGGVLIKDKAGTIVGACGITGDTSDNDEIAASAGIKDAGFVADGG